MNWRSMTKQETIIQRQNEEASLKYQYCARVYFNAASAQNIISWLCCLAALSSVALPLQTNWLAIVIPAILDFIYWISSNRVASLVSTAARLRNDFDDYVLGFKSTISSDDFTFESLEKSHPVSAWQSGSYCSANNDETWTSWRATLCTCHSQRSPVHLSPTDP